MLGRTRRRRPAGRLAPGPEGGGCSPPGQWPTRPTLAKSPQSQPGRRRLRPPRVGGRHSAAIRPRRLAGAAADCGFDAELAHRDLGRPPKLALVVAPPLPSSPLLKPHLALQAHNGGKIHGSGSSAAQAAAPGHRRGSCPAARAPPPPPAGELLPLAAELRRVPAGKLRPRSHAGAPAGELSRLLPAVRSGAARE
ncbi:hypothetical protein PVAP13_6KG289112 [Panicum virgatum]|uniref:Uncharacterized protein n=1 Tax=Panicum virgatum TaxID=38727 RepID=A0A8T0RE48_PANVG|nr:hypothetical protein PVAP13_6KG289112 [Panicum virgatum]